MQKINEFADSEELTLLSQLEKHKKKLKRQVTAYEMWLNEKYLDKGRAIEDV